MKEERVYGGKDERAKLVNKGFLPKMKDSLFSQCVTSDDGCMVYPETTHVLEGFKFNPQRLAYQMSKGRVGKYDTVAARCQNLQCCNPNHLFLLRDQYRREK